MFEFVEAGRRRMPSAALPSARKLHLSGRGTTNVYEMAGPPGAPTVFLLHGLGATGLLNWFPSFAPLSDHYRVVAMDLRGHGRGIAAGPRYRLADCADDVAAVADALDIDTFIPVGYSLGGPVAQLAWHRHRDRVDGLVLCATSATFAGSAVERIFFKGMWAPVLAVRARYLVPSLRRLRARARSTRLPAPDVPHALVIRNVSGWALRELRRCNPAAAIGAVYALGRFDSRAWCGEIDVPTAVVITLDDQLVAASRQYKLAQSIPGATVHTVESDHAACVLGARLFVPKLLEACDAVVERAGATTRTL